MKDTGTGRKHNCHVSTNLPGISHGTEWEALCLAKQYNKNGAFELYFFPFTRREKTAFAIKHVYFHGKSFHLQYLHIMFKYLPQEDIPLNNASVYLLQKSRIAGSPL